MIKNSFIYVILLSLSINCSNNSSLESSEDFSKTDTLHSSKDLNLFAAFKNKDEYQFVVERDKKIFKTQVMKIFPGGLPKFEKFQNDWIYLRGGCGSACFYAYLIPVNVDRQDSLKTYMFPLFMDQLQNVISYCSEDTLIIENYENGKRMSFIDEKLIGPYCGFTIENISIVRTDFVLEINFSDSLVEKKIDITSLLKK